MCVSSSPAAPAAASGSAGSSGAGSSSAMGSISGTGSVSGIMRSTTWVHTTHWHFKCALYEELQDAKCLPSTGWSMLKMSHHACPSWAHTASAERCEGPGWADLGVGQLEGQGRLYHVAAALALALAAHEACCRFRLTAGVQVGRRGLRRVLQGAGGAAKQR